MGEVPGSNPAGSPKNFTHNQINQYNSDTWCQMLGPCVQPLLAEKRHVSISNSLTNIQPTIATSSVCHVSKRYIPPHGRTDCTDRYSQHPNFYLFDLAVKSRYLLHTDSIRENKYTAGIRKTRRTQWNCFRLNPSTLKIEQI